MTPVSITPRIKERERCVGTRTDDVSDRLGIADRFLMARRVAGGLAAYPGDLPATLDEAYAIQDEAIALWEKPVIGWKVGRIQPPLADAVGADRLAGPIFAARFVEGADTPEMPVFAKGFAAGEAEFLLRVGRVPPPGKTRFTLEETADLIDAVHVGIEIASSPLGSINELGPIAIVSDFGNNNGMVVGPAVADWRTSGFEDWQVSTRIDGAGTGSGRASAFPDGAIGAARFLFELNARRGMKLAPGQWISSGAVTGVHNAYPGQKVEADFGGCHTVACRLVAARPLDTPGSNR
jgi:2-keto-4-pentenoate hydratase